MNNARTETLEDIRNRIDAGVWVAVTQDEAEAIALLADGLYDVHVGDNTYFYAVHTKVYDIYLADRVKTEIPADRVVEQAPVVVSAREKALEVCIGNYEEAMGMTLERAAKATSEAKKAELKLAKLITIVKNNTKNAKTILAQIGVDYE